MNSTTYHQHHQSHQQPKISNPLRLSQFKTVKQSHSALINSNYIHSG
jgi:hypothetical protein